MHRNFGNRSSFVREHEAAVRRFTQAYILDPNFRRALLDRGIIYFREMGRLDDAQADFDALLEEDPEYGPALLNRAMLQQERGRYHQSLADLETFLTLPDEDAGYVAIARRTADLLRELVAELDAPPEKAPPEEPTN
ncbi:MAG: tetratricopeptide repeat protein [Candidatus Promineifilaceae bacterium]